MRSAWKYGGKGVRGGATPLSNATRPIEPGAGPENVRSCRRFSQMQFLSLRSPVLLATIANLPYRRFSVSVPHDVPTPAHPKPFVKE
jgi:hypothetical protein